MDDDVRRNADDSRQSSELHDVRLDRPRQLANDDDGTKTFHMAPRQDELGWPDGHNGRDHWPVYDPFTGLRTAAVLGGLMLLMLVYILYKTRCGGRVGRRRWTSKDRLFVERYKRKVSHQVSRTKYIHLYFTKENVTRNSATRTKCHKRVNVKD